MSHTDPLAPLLELGEVRTLMADTSAAIARVHRRPAALRQPVRLAAESAKRGMRLHPLFDGPERPELTIASAYALLLPGEIEKVSAQVVRAPAQVMAQIDVRAGGPGVPSDEAASRRLRAVASVLTTPSVNAELAVHVACAEIVGRRLFGERSHIVGWVLARCFARASGVDPAGLCVPEVYLGRHKEAYHQAMNAWGQGEPEEALEFLLKAWAAGAEEAESMM